MQKNDYELRDLMEEYEDVTRQLMEHLDKLFLLQHKSGMKNSDILKIRIQQQFNTYKSNAIIKFKDNNNNNNNIINATLNTLMEDSYNLDKISHNNMRRELKLIKELTYLRCEYNNVLEESKHLRSKIKPSISEEYALDKNDISLNKKNDTLTQLLITLIMQGGYQGTSDTIDEWLDFLTS